MNKHKKKFSKVLLHFGLDKTGSTSIQSFFHENRHALIDRFGIVYPPGFFHPEIGSFFSSLPEKFVYNFSLDLRDVNFIKNRDFDYFNDLENFLKNLTVCRLIIFSYEGFALLDIDALFRLRAYCLELADSVEVLFYIRPPLSYAVSAMSERTKQGRKSWDWDQLPIQRLKDLVVKLIHVFPKTEIVAKTYDRKNFPSESIVADLCRHIDPNLLGNFDFSTIASNLNESFSSKAIFVGDLVIEALASRNVSYSASKFYSNFGRHFSDIKGRPVSLSEAQRHAIIEASKIDVNYVSTVLGVNWAKDAFLNQSADPVVDDIDSSDIKNIVSAFIKILYDKDEFLIQKTSPNFELISVSNKSGPRVAYASPIFFEIKFQLDPHVLLDYIEIFAINEFGEIASSAKLRIHGKRSPMSSNFYFLCFSFSSKLPKGYYSFGIHCYAFDCVGTSELIAAYGKLCPTEIYLDVSPQFKGYVPALICDQHIESAGEKFELLTEAQGSVEFFENKLNCKAGDFFYISARIQNSSSCEWVGTVDFPLFISYRWLDSNNNVIVYDGLRTAFPTGRLSASSSVDVLISVMAPQIPGEHMLVIIPLLENKFWFDSKGFVPGVVTVSVR